MDIPHKGTEEIISYNPSKPYLDTYPDTYVNREYEYTNNAISP